ncbi:MAG: F0F1 ATP synthase subunit gamma [Anaerolineales bacterium]
MASAREMRQRIRSVGNIAQVTRALEAVSASRVRKAEARVRETRPYAQKSWQVLKHLSRQPGREFVHPLLTKRDVIRNAIVILVSADRGLAGAYNTNVIRCALDAFQQSNVSVKYIAVGRKGRDMLLRKGDEHHAGQSETSDRSTGADRSNEAEPAYIYEPGQSTIVDRIIPRLVGLQVYQAITESLASEHAARMIAMRNATDNADDLSTALTLELLS